MSVQYFYTCYKMINSSIKCDYWNLGENDSGWPLRTYPFVSSPRYEHWWPFPAGHWSCVSVAIDSPSLCALFPKIKRDIKYPNVNLKKKIINHKMAIKVIIFAITCKYM